MNSSALVHDLEGSENVVGVFGPPPRDAILVDDADGLVEGELGTLDVVREVGLVERQESVRRPGAACLGCRGAECCGQKVEPRGSRRVVGLEISAGVQAGGEVRGVPRAERRADQGVHRREGFFGYAEHGSHGPRSVSKSVELLFAVCPANLVDPLAEFVPGQTTWNRTRSHP